METVIEVPTAVPSLLLLNEYCLLEIFEFLKIDDSINLAKTSNRVRFVADRIFKMNSKFVLLDRRMINKGEEYIDHLFQYIGRHVTSVQIDWRRYKHGNFSNILRTISNHCKNLKSLRCRTYAKTSCDRGVQPAYSFDNVELLTFSCCKGYVTEHAEHLTKHFFESFHRLKYVNIQGCSVKSNTLETVLQNNRSIESFVHFNNPDFNWKLVELIPNVERLFLSSCDIKKVSSLELNSLLKLDRLTKLRVSCDFKNVKNFLRELAKKGLIEELELNLIGIDEDFFDTLALFSKLQLLLLETWHDMKINSTISWPAQLKKLRLMGFEWTENDLCAMIQQLESIESIDIEDSYYRNANGNLTNLTDVTKLSQDILHIIDHSNRKHCLDIVLPTDYVNPAAPSKKYLVESERLRILRDPIDPLGIEIHFPGFRFPERKILPINI